MKEVIEQKFSEIHGVTGTVQNSWGKLREILQDILNNAIGKMETETMIKKMEERRKEKTTNVKEYRRLNDQLRRGTDRAKVVYIEDI